MPGAAYVAGVHGLSGRPGCRAEGVAGCAGLPGGGAMPPHSRTSDRATGTGAGRPAPGAGAALQQ